LSTLGLALSGSDSFRKEMRGLSSAFQLLRALPHGSSGRPGKRLIVFSIFALILGIRIDASDDTVECSF
jgi:hypothetical protein